MIMAEPIIVKPQEQSPVIVEGNASKTPINITTDMDYKQVSKMIDERIGDIDFSALAKEDTLTQGISSVESKLEEVGNKIDNIKLPEIDTTELAKEATLNEVSSKLDNINVDVDLSSLAKQGENQEATMSVVYEELMKLNGSYADQIKDIIGE